MTLTDFIKLRPDLLSQKELTFFAGSFNPWHEGHTSCLSLFRANSPVIVIPDHSPAKDLINTDLKDTDLESIDTKLKSLNKTTYLFGDFFLKNKKNPTHKWVEELKTNFPTKSISLLIGFDTFISIDKWIEASKLISNLSTLYIVSRKDSTSLKNDQIKKLKFMNPSLELKFLGNHKFEHLSSTILRHL